MASPPLGPFSSANATRARVASTGSDASTLARPAVTRARIARPAALPPTNSIVVLVIALLSRSVGSRPSGLHVEVHADCITQPECQDETQYDFKELATGRPADGAPMCGSAASAVALPPQRGRDPSRLE